MSTKTVNTLNVGDKVYYPTVEEIKFETVFKIEKTASGVRVGFQNMYYALEDSEYNAAISTFIKNRGLNGRTIFYIRMEDAAAEQRKLRIAALIDLQDKANAALAKLNEFTNKYFID